MSAIRIPVPEANPGFSSVDVFRAYRGVVIHALPWTRANWETIKAYSSRHCVDAYRTRAKKVRGVRVCKWCHRPITGRKQWHPLCFKFFYSCRGSAEDFYGRPVIPGADCAVCGAQGVPTEDQWKRSKSYDWTLEDGWSSEEWDADAEDRHWVRRAAYVRGQRERLDVTEGTIDHRTPIALARLRSPGEFVRAFLPANLQWLCAECHKVKTAQDFGEIARVKRERKRRQLQLSY